MLEMHINRKPEEGDNIIAQAWRYLFESWQSPSTEKLQLMPYALQDDIKNYGWNDFSIRQFTKSIQPHILASPISSFRHTKLEEASKPAHLLHLDVIYPSLPVVDIPDDYLVEAAIALKKQLELASSLEKEIGNIGLHNFNVSIVSPLTDDSRSPSGEVSGYIKLYISILLKLKDQDIDAVRREVLSWPYDNLIFKRFRIWAASLKDLTQPDIANQIFCKLDESAFWSNSFESDLLHSISMRWQDLWLFQSIRPLIPVTSAQ